MTIRDLLKHHRGDLEVNIKIDDNSHFDCEYLGYYFSNITDGATYSEIKKLAPALLDFEAVYYDTPWEDGEPFFIEVSKPYAVPVDRPLYDKISKAIDALETEGADAWTRLDSLLPKGVTSHFEYNRLYFVKNDYSFNVVIVPADHYKANLREFLKGTPNNALLSIGDINTNELLPELTYSELKRSKFFKDNAHRRVTSWDGDMCGDVVCLGINIDV